MPVLLTCPSSSQLSGLRSIPMCLSELRSKLFPFSAPSTLNPCLWSSMLLAGCCGLQQNIREQYRQHCRGQAVLSVFKILSISLTAKAPAKCTWYLPSSCTLACCKSVVQLKIDQLTGCSLIALIGQAIGQVLPPAICATLMLGPYLQGYNVQHDCSSCWVRCSVCESGRCCKNKK